MKLFYCKRGREGWEGGQVIAAISKEEAFSYAKDSDRDENYSLANVTELLPGVTVTRDDGQTGSMLVYWDDAR